MRVTITSRIFDPEPSAAAFRLRALARCFSDNGHDVVVLTVRPPVNLPAGDGARPYRVRRFPVLRDKSGYVRGYVQYMSFDIPLFFRILFGPKRDFLVTEPPPTTGFFVRLAAALRRTPYAYYAADIWSDAAVQTGASSWVIRVVRAMEVFALNGAAQVLSVSDGVTERLGELGIRSPIETIGNGVDAELLRSTLVNCAVLPVDEAPTFVYAGTASEVHGAAVFVEAMVAVLNSHPTATLKFIGGGAEQDTLKALADELGIARAVSFAPPMDAASLAPILHRSTAALASVRPGQGYDFSFPTKLYTAAVCGAPLVYSGIGPGAEFVRTLVHEEPLGYAVGSDPAVLSAAMCEAIERPFDSQRRDAVMEWAADKLTLSAVAKRAVETLERKSMSAGLPGDTRVS